MTPTVFRQGPFRFLSFSRKETRIHVHGSHPEGEAKFWLSPHVELSKQTGFAEHVVDEARQWVRDHLREIVDAWTSTWPAEISHISQHGLWVLLDTEELFWPFDQFPWFRNATIDHICSVVRPTADHLDWE